MATNKKKMSREEGLAKWESTHKDLAAAKKERDRTRGTRETTNPLMKDMKSRMPAAKPKAGPKKSAPVSGEGRQALHMADKEDKARARRTAPVSGEGRQALRMADKENNTKQKKARQSLNDALKSVKRRNSK